MSDYPVMTAAAAEAFAAYVELGPKRSLESLASMYRNSAEPAPTKHLRTLKDWSAKFQWQARITEAVTAAASRKLELAAELDADTFFKTSERLNETVSGPGFIDPGNLTRIRESVRKPEPKQSASIDVTHSGTIKHAHHDMSAFTDEEIDTLAELAEKKLAEASV